MTYEVIITPEAEQQIINLHRYITEKAGNVIADNYANALLIILMGFLHSRIGAINAMIFARGCG
ncbi:hypothetical protein NYV58_11700 [Escherichia coli]|nr:hypothetical protein [Escherichia coli]